MLHRYTVQSALSRASRQNPGIPQAVPKVGRCGAPSACTFEPCLPRNSVLVFAAGKTPEIDPDSMSIQRLDVGPILSEATVHAGVVYLAGQVPEDADADMKAQSESVLKCIDDLLARSGTDKSKILMAMVYIVNFDDFPVFNEVWKNWVTPGATPARATVQVGKLANPGWKLEIVCTCAV